MEIMDIDCSEYLEYLHCYWNTMEIKGIFRGNVVGMGGLSDNILLKIMRTGACQDKYCA